MLVLACGPIDNDGDRYLANDENPAQVDCDDNDRDVNPAAEEVPYNGKDDDCDPATRDDDLDGDGFDAIADCDDNDAGSYTGAPETCDGADNDCDGVIDNNTGDTYFADADGDGYGDPLSPERFCEAAEGYVDDNTDCDDEDDAVHPGADETCNNADDDCNGVTDDDAVDATVVYIDYDGDGAGSEAFTLPVCGESPEGWVATATDCDDTNASALPGGSEVCDGVDNDCDGEIDEGAAAPSSWYLDYDGDGFGDDARAVTACEAPTADYIATGGDCDDTDSATTTGC
jgi:hypothetical protein